MSSMNVVVLVGRLVSEPELRYTGSGTAVCSFTLAVDDGFGQQKKTYYIDCVAWQKTAETVHKYTSKGTLVGIQGRITQERWEKDGQKRSAIKVVAERLTLMPKISNNNNNGHHDAGGQQDYDDLNAVGVTDSQMPF